MASVEEVVARLESQGLQIEQIRELPNGQRQILPIDIDACVNVWPNGSCNVQGRESDALARAVGDLIGSGRRRRRTAPPTVRPEHEPIDESGGREVFVVYGHDEPCRTELEAMLRRWHLEPLILDQLPSEGATIIEKLEKYGQNVGFAVVLATPDDEGHRSGSESEKTFRARQNVVLELGMMLNQLGRARVAILLKNASSMERPSDIDGLIYLSFKDSVEEVKLTLAKEMKSQGYDIQLERV